MAINQIPVTPITPIVGIGDTVATLTSRAKITGTTGLTAVTATSTYGTRIDEIVVHCAANSAQAIIFIWIFDGTTSFLYDEIPVAASTVSNTVAGTHVSRKYYNLVLPPTYRLYATTTIAQNTDVFAHGGQF